MFVISWLVHCLLVLLSVAFFTLFERKVIGLFHLRLGPNKVSFIGLSQPLLDAFNLLSNQDLYPLRSNKVAYFMSPLFSLFLALFVWLTLPIAFSTLALNFSLILFFFVGSIIVFCVLLSGWSSNSNYSLIGSLRSVAQSVSYESVFSTLIVIASTFYLTYSIQSFQNGTSWLFVILAPLWFICTLAETHRAPFDFAEAESELVSGFNTEYSGAFFALIFLSEYAVLLYSCELMSYLFLSFNLPVGGGALLPLHLVLSTMVLSYSFIWVRITFCRFRYDLLIITAWNVLLPISLLGFILVGLSALT